MFGRYELLAPLARGGMAEVFLARMTGVGGFSKLLVIKRMLPHLRDDPVFRQMFLDEGRIAARLDHPNVCHVYELGEVDGDAYLAMEYLAGAAWSEIVKRVPRGDAFPLRCAAGVIGQICDGLRYAHELRDVEGAPTPVVHRDVSPQNLMLTTTGVCKLLDFGVSKVLTEGSRTRTGMLKGKLPYMAPEQIRGEPIDARADVFSTGVVLWEAMTGERLFSRESDYQIWRAITEEPIPQVAPRRPGVPPAIDEVIGRALERDPARRYPSIRAFAADLRRVADAVGGPLDAAAIADMLHALAAPELAERARLVSLAAGRAAADPDLQRAPREVAVTAQQPVAGTSDTHSVQLRDESVRLGRRRRRWPWALGFGLAAGAGVGAAFLSAPSDPPDLPAPAPLARSSGAAIDAALADPPAAAGPASSATPEAGAPEAGAPDLDAIDLPVRPARPRRADARHARPARDAEPGQYSIDSRPYATIYIDGKSHGETPLFRVPLAPGRHSVRAVLADGRVKQLGITIEPGKLVSSGTLAW